MAPHKNTDARTLTRRGVEQLISRATGAKSPVCVTDGVTELLATSIVYAAVKLGITWHNMKIIYITGVIINRDKGFVMKNYMFSYTLKHEAVGPFNASCAHYQRLTEGAFI